MGFKLANIDGKSALIHGDSYYDINSISQGEITSDPSYILALLAFTDAASSTGSIPAL